MWAGADLTWHRPIARGTEAPLLDLVEHRTRFAGRAVQQVYRHRSQIRHHNIVGDAIVITGKVTAKGVDGDGHAFVTVEQEAHNQHGELSARGTGTVRLPTRA